MGVRVDERGGNTMKSKCDCRERETKRIEVDDV